MSAIDPRSGRSPQIRRRARLVSWGFAPLALGGLVAWFLFNIAFCMGGHVSVWTLWLCDRFDKVPEMLGLILLGALIWFVMALHDLGRLREADAATNGRWRITRHAANVRGAYTGLDDEDKSSAWFAVEMSLWVAVMAAGTLIYYWTEYAFPLGLAVIAGLVMMMFRVARRGNRAARRRWTRRRPSGG